VIFRPDPASVAYVPGQEYEVSISGLRLEGSLELTSIVYRTRFIRLDGATPDVTWTRPALTVGHAATTAISGAVSMDASGLAGIPVRLLESSDGSRFRETGQTSETGSDGTFRFTIHADAKRWYRVVTEPAGELSARTGPVCTVTPQVALAAPWAPSSARTGVGFTVFGRIAPTHGPSTRSTVVRCYRLENGRWVLRASARVSVSGSRYSGLVRLLSRGVWRLRAVHSDAGHAWTASGYRSVRAVR
jgi:hypothetical protein